MSNEKLIKSTETSKDTKMYHGDIKERSIFFDPQISGFFLLSIFFFLIILKLWMYFTKMSINYVVSISSRLFFKM